MRSTNSYSISATPARWPGVVELSLRMRECLCGMAAAGNKPQRNLTHGDSTKEAGR
jgi:hypothetical protein